MLYDEKRSVGFRMPSEFDSGLKSDHARRTVSTQAHAQQSGGRRSHALQRSEFAGTEPGTPASTVLGSAKLG